MIRINSIEIKDFGRHEHLKQEFNGSVIGLCGSNGLGKSTVLQALQFGLTGMIDHPDPLRAFIRRSGCENPPKAAVVILEFEANGKKGKITRRISKSQSTRTLEWDGAKLKAEKKVAGVLFDILGVDKKAINSTVFIRQGEMASMFGRDSERRDFYTRLLMLGHMEKIGDVAETYRKQVADSVQDLGAARDAADETYTGASTYFETCAAELDGISFDPAVMQKLRDLLSLFNYYETASKDVSDASAIFQETTGSDDPQAVRLKLEKDVAAWQKQRQELSERKGLHIAATEKYQTADRAHQSAAALREDQQKLQVVLSDVAKLGNIGEDPRPALAKAEKKLEGFKRLRALNEALIPGAATLTEQLLAEKTIAESDFERCDSAYAEARIAFSKKSSELEMRTELQTEMAKHHEELAATCSVCGSDSPDHEFLARSIKAAKEDLDKLKEAGAPVGDAYRGAKAVRDSCVTAHQTAATRESDLRNEANTLRVGLLTTSEAAVGQSILDLKLQSDKFVQKEGESNRLQEVARQLATSIGGREDVTFAELETLASAAATALAECRQHPWTSEHAVTEADVIANLTRDSEHLANVNAGHTRWQVATTKLAAHEEELRESLNSADIKEILKRDKDNIVTPQEVSQMIADRELLQNRYEEAKGKHEAANVALRRASDRVSELELRTAEQKHRLKLAEDIGKLRDAFKPNGVSLEFLNYKFGQIAQVAGNYLAESGADFMITASEVLPLAYEFMRTDRPNEVWMPQSRMSGGQQVRLGVATLRAIHSLVMPDVGLLSLDEPTTHLDDDAKRSMADMLRQIGQEGTLQMVVCDHSPILIDAFSDTITLPE